MARLARARTSSRSICPGTGRRRRGRRGALSLAALSRRRGRARGALRLGPSVLVGHSMGALVAIEAALAWPDKVRGPRAVRRGAAPARARRAARADPTTTTRTSRRGWPSTRCRRARSRPCGARSWRRASSRRPRSRSPTSRPCGRPTSASASGSVTCPVLWLDGADDAIVGARGRAARGGAAAGGRGAPRADRGAGGGGGGGGGGPRGRRRAKRSPAVHRPDFAGSDNVLRSQTCNGADVGTGGNSCAARRLSWAGPFLLAGVAACSPPPGAPKKIDETDLVVLVNNTPAGGDRPVRRRAHGGRLSSRSHAARPQAEPASGRPPSTRSSTS